MTGLWQVSGRSRLTFEEMIRLCSHGARTDAQGRACHSRVVA